LWITACFCFSDMDRVNGSGGIRAQCVGKGDVSDNAFLIGKPG
jgi:hypothetical protein